MWSSSLFSMRQLLQDDGQTGLRPESCWNDCLTRRKSIRPCVPSHVAYEVGAARQQTVRSPRTMYPHSQEWPRNREATEGCDVEIQARVERLVKGDAASQRMDRKGVSRSIGRIAAQSRETACRS